MDEELRAALPRGWKTKARDRCRAIVRDTPDGPVTGTEGAFLAALLTLHPDADEKIGSGIAFIAVGPVPRFRSRGFTVHRTDGTSTDFSWLECISPTSHRARVLTAMREAVVDQILTFKQAEADAGRLRCAITGAGLTWTDAEVDHLPPTFLTLADNYAAQVGGYDKVRLVPSADGMIGQPLAPDDERAWVLYHQREARLRILSRPAHAEVTRQQRTGYAS
jgi:hypothetical protein